MADVYIQNNEIRVGINYHGAELVSLVRIADGREYMWCGDPAYWGRVSPVLFPFVGKLNDLQYRIGETVYSGVPQHGYARDCDFVLAEKLDDTAWFELRPDDQWRERYPYEFLLRIGYRVEGRSLHVMWTVRNDSATEMHFSIGGHPAFAFPDGKKMDGFYADIHKDVSEVWVDKINDEGLALPEKKCVAADHGKIAFSDELFLGDALILTSNDIHTVTLAGKECGPYLQVRFDTPQFGIWSPVGKSAPFVCLEPWFGRCDRVGYAGELKDREYGNTISPGHSFNKEYVIDIL